MRPILLFLNKIIIIIEIISFPNILYDGVILAFETDLNI